MGWLFSEQWPTRKALIKHLVEGNGVKTLKHCMVGNDLWCVHEYEARNRTIRFVCLYMLRGPLPKNAKYEGRDRNWWGYKDIDETMGPVKLSCPESYISMCTAPESEWAYQWRQRIYEKARKARRMKVGSRWSLAGYPGQVYTILKRINPQMFLVERLDGLRNRLSLKLLNTAGMEVVCGECS